VEHEEHALFAHQDVDEAGLEALGDLADAGQEIDDRVAALVRAGPGRSARRCTPHDVLVHGRAQGIRVAARARVPGAPRQQGVRMFRHGSIIH
jgi:hypothetical protein